MCKVYKNTIQNFKTISLTELNAKASYLKRIDKKFLLSSSQFKEIFAELGKNFKVLEIKWQKIFSYDNVYMDTDDYLFYNQHQNKNKSRTKIRTRYYVDSNLAFFEYKYKTDWITNKYRYSFPSEEHWFMTRGKNRFFQWVWQSMFGLEKAPQITPSIKTKYKRITLINNSGNERLTIDFDITTQDLRDKNSKEISLKNLVIVESKSLSKECNSCKIMTKHWIKKAKSCSKYSLWVIYSWLAQKYDTFKTTMEKIKEIRLDTLKKRKRKSNLAKQTGKIIKKQFTTKKLNVIK